MTSPAITVTWDAGFREIISAFHLHTGRSMPVVDDQGRLQGLLLLKDFVKPTIWKSCCELEDVFPQKCGASTRGSPPG